MNRIAAKLGVGRHYAIGLVTVVVMAVVLVADYTGALRGLFTGSGEEVTATFSNVGTLVKGDPVRVRGVQVGEVKRIVALGGGRGTQVTMGVKEAGMPLYENARARISWRSLLGGAFVVELDPGNPARGTLGDASIPISATSSQVELDDITAVASGDARQGLRTMPLELSQAFSDAPTLSRLAGTLADVSPDLDRGLGGLRGQLQDKDLRDLVDATGDLMHAIDQPAPLTTLVQSSAVTFQTTARRAAEIRATLAQAPAAMDNTNATLVALDRTLGIARPLVDQLDGASGDVAPTLRSLAPVVSGADSLLTRARPLLGDLRPAVSALASVGRNGVPLLNAIEPSLARLDDTVLPYLDEKSPETGHTTAEMIGPGAGGLALVATQIDPNGHYLRFPASAGNSSLYLPCQTYFGNPTSSSFLQCKSTNELLETYLTYDPTSGAPGTSPSAERKR